MKTKLNPIKKNETSKEVSVLHKAIRALGHTINETEIKQRKAGKETIARINAFQKVHNIKGENGVLTNEATLEAIQKELKKRGLLKAENSFTIRGRVADQTRKVRKNQQLLAFDLDLKGIAKVSSLKTIQDLEKVQGFEFLGKTNSDNKGFYSISFYDWQYKRTERKKADVVIFVIEENSIIGRSRMVNVSDYDTKGQVSNFNIIVNNKDKRTEYQKLKQTLLPFFKENNCTPGDIAKSTEQLIFSSNELDVPQGLLLLFAQAENLSKIIKEKEVHEILYGIGRQKIRLSTKIFFKKKEGELLNAIKISVSQKFISAPKKQDLQNFLKAIKRVTIASLLDANNKEEGSLDSLLSTALQSKRQKAIFLNAIQTFDGTDYKKFWTEHLPKQPQFKKNPKLIDKLLHTQRLTVLTINNSKLVQELSNSTKTDSIAKIMALSDDNWASMIKKSGAPEMIKGKNEEEKRAKYIGFLKNNLNAAFPTTRIALDLKKKGLPGIKKTTAKNILIFIEKNSEFDFSKTRVVDFEKQIKEVGGVNTKDLKESLTKIERLYQVSVNSDSIGVLMQNNFNSARAIADVPKKAFIANYGSSLGGKEVAFAIHERASFVSTKIDMAATNIKDHLGLIPEYILPKGGRDKIATTLDNNIPNWKELFGSPDICECKHCRSIYSPAAYFVDILRFLWRGEKNDQGKSPLDILESRRPDLLHLGLTCENSHTVIPYIDLVNEILEFYTVHGSLSNYQGYNTGGTTSKELRANPQNQNIGAYKTVYEMVYPFSLPYHQPLDTIRTFTNHVKTSKYALMNFTRNDTSIVTDRAIVAERLNLSPKEYEILSGKKIEGTNVTTPVHRYYGYTIAGKLENGSKVNEFLERSGIKYTELVALLETNFINPNRLHLEFLETIFAPATISADELYNILLSIANGSTTTSVESVIKNALNTYNSEQNISISNKEFDAWVVDYFSDFRKIITLYEPESKCSLDTTSLKTLKNIYEGLSTSGISTDSWSKIHRFIRLWRKLDWSIQELDIVLTALGFNDINTDTLDQLGAVLNVADKTKLSAEKLACLWGNINIWGEKSLYENLFLNKASQTIDESFEADQWGRYLQNTTETIEGHKDYILAAFRINEDELNGIFEVAQVKDAGVLRNITTNDTLSLNNLSQLYRYVILAKSLKTKVLDFIESIKLFNAEPYSYFNLQNSKYEDISAKKTNEFIELLQSVKPAGFKAEELTYIVEGTIKPDSKIGLDEVKLLQTVKDIRNVFDTIEQDHPDVSEIPLTIDGLTNTLSYTFSDEIIVELTSILENTISHEVITEPNLSVTISEELLPKYNYVKGSGRLMVNGVMSNSERTKLKALTNANTAFKNSVDNLYNLPFEFLDMHFSGILTDEIEIKKIILDRPSQGVNAADLNEKVQYVYQAYLPSFKAKLRKDALIQHIGSIISLDNDKTSLLLEPQVNGIISKIIQTGYSGAYFSDNNFGTQVVSKTDATLDFDWENNAPEIGVPVNNFSIRWEAYLASPASGVYTLQVNVNGLDETFKLYLDDALILEKNASNSNTSWEVIVDLNAATMHRLRIDYVDISGNASVNLKWKTDSTALENIPTKNLFPTKLVNEFMADSDIYKRASLFISNFKLSTNELNHFLKNASNFDGIDFYQLRTNHWEIIRDYKELVQNTPQTQAFLIDIFQQANATPIPSISNIVETILLTSAWEETSLDYLINDHFGFGVSDFKNTEALYSLMKIMQLVNQTGITAATLCVIGNPETNFDTLLEQAQLVKNAVRSKYDEKTWMNIASDLNDKLREHQKEALIAYILQQNEIKTANIKDANGLFEYFLIDVEMTACMDTSRIVQANSSIQQFVSRCQLNLESNLSTGNEHGISPSFLDADRWEWMKNYRVWEANRKVFVTPENWLEPEWRMDRSEFFKELESHLLQNDITDRSVEEGFRNYLSQVNKVANLEVCGSYRETYDGTDKLKFLHVFARTNNAPFNYFYRRWNEYGKWSAWESVPVDIRSVNTDDAFGVPLIPIVWKNRLFLFWAEFFEKTRSNASGSNKSFEDTAGDSISSLEPRKDWQVKLAWSEYVDGKWTPKQLSNASMVLFGNSSWNEGSASFSSSINPSTQELRITFWVNQDFATAGDFVLSDIQSPISIDASFMNPNAGFTSYMSNFQKRQLTYKFESTGNTYLDKHLTHTILGSNNHAYLEKNLSSPFFYTGDKRTYFVKPKSISILGPITDPGWFEPILPPLEPIFPINPFDPFDPIDPIDPFGPLFPEEPMLPIYSGDNFNPQIWDENLNETNPFDYVISGNTIQPISATYEDEYLLPMNYTADMGSQPRKLKMEASKDSLAFSEQFSYNMYDVPAAMGGYQVEFDDWYIYPRILTKGLEFHTFYHPYSSEYVKNLNQGGVSKGTKGSYYPPGLMESDTTLTDDKGDLFTSKYNPNFTNGLIQKPSDFSDVNRTYFKENVCFDPLGANSIYNWELFFHAPLYVATRLSKNGKYKEALKWFHYIFNPTTDELPKAGDSEVSRYWQVLPFKKELPQSMEDWFRENLEPNDNSTQEDNIIGEWRDNPFNPHTVASNRPLAYMKHVIIKYIENLVAWGDSLFRQHSMESVNEALQIYVIASHILGKRPEFVPKRGTIKEETYTTLMDKWDDFSNALVEMENIFPYSSSVSVSESDSGINLLGIGSSFYFCIPNNEKLLENWDTVEDRLYKIRHCLDINGVESKLALFSPPIDPAALINAASKGLSLGSILADLSSPAPIYRFTYLIQKSNEFCNDVKSLGSLLLSVLERKDAEELSLLRASQETIMQELITAVKERNVLDSKAYKENLETARETAKQRLQYFTDLLGNDSLTIPGAPSVSASLTADSSLPATTNIASIETDVDVSLADSDEAGVKLIPKEVQELSKNDNAKDSTSTGNMIDAIGGLMNFIPTFSGNIQPFGIGLSMSYGGSNIAGGMSGIARFFHGDAAKSLSDASKAAKLGGYIRRDQDWTFRANTAARQVVEIDKQLVSADIRIQVTEKELENHLKSIEQVKEVELFIKDKYTNQELYQWMKEQLYAVYKQSYNLAYDMAKKTEKSYQYEIGVTTSSFVQYGYWEDTKKGLVAGDKLQLALRQMEKSYLEENKRELELTKHVSILRLNPFALLELKKTGKCYVSLPEELFDMDYQGHYFRRLKSVQISIPCIVGPSIAVNCSLRLLNNSLRINTAMNDSGEYQHNNDEGILIDDVRFRRNNVPVTAIATSSAQNDSGMFEFNFRDERYLPFEGAGAISEWQLELTTEEDLRQFDYDSISDVIMHLNYTAKENGGLFKENVITYLKDFIVNTADVENQPFKQMFSLKHEFSTAWHKFLYPTNISDNQELNLEMSDNHFPFFTTGKTLNIKQIDVLIQSVKSGDYKTILSAIDKDDDTVIMTSSELNAPESSIYNNQLQVVSLSGATTGVDIEAVDIKSTINLKVRHSSSSVDDFKALETNPEELENIYLIIHYSL